MSTSTIPRQVRATQAKDIRVGDVIEVDTQAVTGPEEATVGLVSKNDRAVYLVVTLGTSIIPLVRAHNPADPVVRLDVAYPPTLAEMVLKGEVKPDLANVMMEGIVARVEKSGGGAPAPLIFALKEVRSALRLSLGQAMDMMNDLTDEYRAEQS